jgi:hypothetical protein
MSNQIIISSGCDAIHILFLLVSKMHLILHKIKPELKLINIRVLMDRDNNYMKIPVQMSHHILQNITQNDNTRSIVETSSLDTKLYSEQQCFIPACHIVALNGVLHPSIS